MNNKPPQIKFKIFKAWIDKQPDNRKFNYTDCKECLISSFFREIYGLEVCVNPTHYRLSSEFSDDSYEKIPAWLNNEDIIHSCDNISLMKFILNNLSG